MVPPFVTYSLSMPIELTRLCSNRCEFCPYPFTAHAPLLSFRNLKRAIRKAQTMGATMVDFVSGENLEEMPEIKRVLRYYHLHSYMGYLVGAAELAYHPQQGASIPARLDVGPLSAEYWELARPHFESAKLLLTTVDPQVLATGSLANAPSQHPEVRLQSIIDAGNTGLPIASGTLIGIGESKAAREKAIRVLAQVAGRYGHIYTILIQAYRPNPATPMADHVPVNFEAMRDCVAYARRAFPPAVRIQINALDWAGHLPELVAAGAGDLGDLNLRVLGGHNRNAAMELDLLLRPLREMGIETRLRGIFPGTRPGTKS